MEQANSSEQGAAKVKNGLPRVIWESPPNAGKRFRIVLAEGSQESFAREYAGVGKVLVLERWDGLDGMGVDRWRRVRAGDGESEVTDLAWALAREVHQLAGPDCMECLDVGRFPGGDGRGTFCPDCERGAQMAAAQRRSE